MQYFDESEDKFSRIGRVIGDILSALVYIGVLILMVTRFA
jgi:hypothetical protein